MFTHVVEAGVMGDLLGYQHYHNANASTRALDESSPRKYETSVMYKISL